MRAIFMNRILNRNGRRWRAIVTGPGIWRDDLARDRHFCCRATPLYKRRNQRLRQALLRAAGVASLHRPTSAAAGLTTQSARQLLCREGFRQVGVAAALPKLFLINQKSRRDQHRNAPRIIAAFQRAGGFEARHVGQLNVHHDQVGPHPAGQFDADCASIASRTRALVASGTWQRTSG